MGVGITMTHRYFDLGVEPPPEPPDYNVPLCPELSSWSAICPGLITRFAMVAIMRKDG